LFNQYRGTGKIFGNKEVVNFNEVIGKVNDQDTTWGTIHYDKNGGYHIVPAAPRQLRRI